MKQSAAYAAIRQIATLGYSPELALSALIPAIRDIVPYEKATFLWMDEGCNAIDWYGPLPVPADTIRLYLEQFYNRREAEVIPSSRELVMVRGTDRSANIPSFRFQGSDFFNLVLKPGENRHYLRLAIRNGTRPIGILILLRPPGSRDFTEKEEMGLSRMSPWLTHALVSCADVAMEETLVENNSGLIVADAKGTVLFFSQGARELLHRAADVPINRRTLDDHVDWAKTLIDRLMRALPDASDGKDAPHAPVLEIRNTAGHFVLRAYWMESATQGTGKCAAIQIQHQVPLSLRLMQSQRLRKMPPRDQQACLLLAQGLSSTEIAKRMGISRNGAVYHIRSSYSRLGISRQEELVSTLLKPES